jgi:flagellar basal body-associated protein FliL
MNNNGSSTGIIVGILVIVVIAIVAWIAYAQGFFQAKQQPQTQDSAGVHVDLGGSSNTSNTSGGY